MRSNQAIRYEKKHHLGCFGVRPTQVEAWLAPLIRLTSVASSTEQNVLIMLLPH